MCSQMAVVVVVVFLSPQASEDDPEKRLCTRWKACRFMDGHLKVQPLAVRVKGGTTEPPVVVRLIFTIADPTRSFFRSVDQVLSTTKFRIVTTRWLSFTGYVAVWSDLEMNGVEQAR